jgi:hypothetical protein
MGARVRTCELAVVAGLSSLVILALQLVFAYPRVSRYADIGHALRLARRKVPLRDSAIYIIAVADLKFMSEQATQHRSMLCYATRSGYSFLQILPERDFPDCILKHKNFFFRKHCAVLEWLKLQNNSVTAAVMDGDMVGGTSDLTLSRWLNAWDFDLAFYERVNHEIMAGGYIIRNTAYAQWFIKNWIQYEFLAPVGGNSNHDNGALHLALLDALFLPEREECFLLYRNLTDPGWEPEHMKKYYNYVACTRRALGGTGNFLASGRNEDRVIEGKITVYPRLFGFAVDLFLDPRARELHPFHHGVKHEAQLAQFYAPFGSGEGDERCVSFTNRTSRSALVEKVKANEAEAVNSTSLHPHGVVPHWPHENARFCLDALWCPPVMRRLKGGDGQRDS